MSAVVLSRQGDGCSGAQQAGCWCLGSLDGSNSSPKRPGQCCTALAKRETDQDQTSCSSGVLFRAGKARILFSS